MARTWCTIFELPGTMSAAVKYRSSMKEVATLKQR